MTLTIERQVALSGDENLPQQSDLQRAANAALIAASKVAIPYDTAHVITVRIVAPEESQALNRDWRGKDNATNVLAFPAPPTLFDDEDEVAHAGDLVICAEVVAREAREQRKSHSAHWTHMMIHGCLHLMGYDHIAPEDAATMEAIERDAMQCLGLPDPYV